MVAAMEIESISKCMDIKDDLEERLGALSDASPPAKISLASTYENLIASISTEGFWQDKELILGFIKNKQVLEELLSIHEYKVILTCVALHVLATKFGDKKNEWKMIHKKAQKWLA